MKKFNWYIEITKENYDMLLEWRKSQPNYNKSWDYCFEIGHCVTNKHISDDSNIIACHEREIKQEQTVGNDYYSDYVNLTTEEFKQLVLNLKDMKQPTQTITRKQLGLIYNVACDTWKLKIEKLAKRDPFSNDIVLTNDEVTEMFEASDNTQIKVLESVGLTLENEYITLEYTDTGLRTPNGGLIELGIGLAPTQYKNKCLIPIGKEAKELTPEILDNNGRWMIVFKNKK